MTSEVQFRRTPAAATTLKPRPEAAEAARGPYDPHSLLGRFSDAGRSEQKNHSKRNRFERKFTRGPLPVRGRDPSAARDKRCGQGTLTPSTRSSPATILSRKGSRREEFAITTCLSGRGPRWQKSGEPPAHILNL